MRTYSQDQTIKERAITYSIALLVGLFCLACTIKSEANTRVAIEKIVMDLNSQGVK